MMSYEYLYLRNLSHKNLEVMNDLSKNTQRFKLKALSNYQENLHTAKI